MTRIFTWIKQGIKSSLVENSIEISSLIKKKKKKKKKEGKNF